MCCAASPCFRDTFTEIAREYPDVEADYLYADAAAEAMVLDPGASTSS